MTRLNEIRKRIEASDTNTNPLYPYSGSFEQVSEDIQWLLEKLEIAEYALESMIAKTHSWIITRDTAEIESPIHESYRNKAEEALKKIRGER
jgi:hypothetical protein